MGNIVIIKHTVYILLLYISHLLLEYENNKLHEASFYHTNPNLENEIALEINFGEKSYETSILLYFVYLCIKIKKDT